MSYTLFMRYLGVDYGSKKVGISLSDPNGTMGFPHSVVRTHEAESKVRDLIENEHVETVVIGESFDFQGNENPIASGAKAFAERLATYGVVVVFEPEMLTSAEARRMQERPQKSRSPKSHEPIDASAAALILTSYLTKHAHSR